MDEKQRAKNKGIVYNLLQVLDNESELHHMPTCEAEKLTHSTDTELNELAFRVVDVLDGLPIGQALYVLETVAPSLIKDGHVVGVTNPRYLAVRSGIA